MTRITNWIIGGAIAASIIALAAAVDVKKAQGVEVPECKIPAGVIENEVGDNDNILLNRNDIEMFTAYFESRGVRLPPWFGLAYEGIMFQTPSAAQKGFVLFLLGTYYQNDCVYMGMAIPERFVGGQAPEAPGQEAQQ